MNEQARVLSLQEVAAWQFSEILKTPEERFSLSEFHPGIPSLQRGAIWKPRQIEFLWDSLMRGFPIGSFVFCNLIAGQTEHCGKHGGNKVRVPFTHHLLDGQQRSDAIALGFLDPLAPPNPDPSALLWIDLNPVKLSGSRRFLFRVTTKAHPWGYDDNEDCSKLEVSKIKESLGRHNPKDPRPGPIELRPWKAAAPIPFAWLIDGVAQGMGGQNLWERLQQKIEEFGSINPRFKQIAFSEFSIGQFEAIEAGVSRALQCRLVALGVPSGVLLDEAVQGQKDDGIEHLFQRLNSAGTRLEGADLNYSMIKAYWPGIEGVLDGLKTCPTSFARLADFGFRLSNPADFPKIPGTLGISKIRSLAKSNEELLKPYREYLGLRESPSDAVVPFVQDLEQVDDWLLWRSPEDFGLPPAVRMELVNGNPELYLCLLRLARIGRESSLSLQDPALRRRIVGMATAIHWFCPANDSSKKFAAERVLAHVLDGNGEFVAKSFRGILAACIRDGERRGISQILAPMDLEDVIPKIHPGDSESLKEWRLWDVVVKPNQEGHAEREQEIWPFVSSLRYNRNLLLYCQRDYLGSRWSHFDKATPDMWEDHNRPWDYDHILPAATLYYNHRVYMKTAAEWLNTIGNSRAWPLEENRSKQDQRACETITGDDIGYSFLLNPDEVTDFSLKAVDISDPLKTLGFLNSARARMLRMYKHWFEILEIGFLLESTDSQIPHVARRAE